MAKIDSLSLFFRQATGNSFLKIGYTNYTGMNFNRLSFPDFFERPIQRGYLADFNLERILDEERQVSVITFDT